ncbi:MAG: tRNA (guanosine(46)-N7)-methyltransferase TrmB [Gammaproteobacteria bacterium]|nr:tRNA (guanosine(46)-N7)-methyltransferase TrmB [Gammaproteobacteria bacterium]
MAETSGAPRRAVRSFVIRAGRMTEAQQRALAELLPRYRLALSDLHAGLGHVLPRGTPLHLEIGSGNGDNALALATARPGIDLIAAEVHPPGVGHTVLEAARRGLDNLKVFDGDALELLAALPAASLDAVYVFFPDPWPKKRHHKRRLVQGELLDLLATRLKAHGVARFASDDADYAEQVRAALTAEAGWLNVAGEGAWAPRPHARIVTRFEGRARRDGRAVFELAWMRRPTA